MEPVQVLLFTVVSILTGILVSVGIQVFIVLHEAKKTLSRVNKILQNAENISDVVARPVQGISNFMEGARNLKGVLDMLVEKHDKSETIRSFEERFVAPTIYPEMKMEVEEKVEATHPKISFLQERGRRFFHKSGKSLSS